METSKMTKILKFNTKAEKFKNWLKKCFKDFEKYPPKSCLLLWETQQEDGNVKAYHSKYNCDFETLAYFLNCLEDKFFEMRVEKYLTDLDNEDL